MVMFVKKWPEKIYYGNICEKNGRFCVVIRQAHWLYTILINVYHIYFIWKYLLLSEEPI